MEATHIFCLILVLLDDLALERRDDFLAGEWHDGCLETVACQCYDLSSSPLPETSDGKLKRLHWNGTRKYSQNLHCIFSHSSPQQQHSVQGGTDERTFDRVPQFWQQYFHLDYRIAKVATTTWPATATLCKKLLLWQLSAILLEEPFKDICGSTKLFQSEIIVFNLY